MTSNTPALEILEVFPQTRANPQYFAELGDKLPQKLKSGVTFFMLQQLPELLEDPALPDPSAPSPPPPSSEEGSPKKRRRKRKGDGEDTAETPKDDEPEKPAKKPIKKKQANTEPLYKLYLKATQDGVLGKKGELVEAQKIPSGTLIHLVKRRKYVQTMIYYENTWYKL